MKRYLIILFFAGSVAAAEEVEKSNEGLNLSAIPPVITVEDAKLDLTVEEQLILLNRKKADYVLKDVRIGDNKVPSQYEKKLEEIHQEKFNENPRQTIPIKECIKPNNVIDNDVHECMNGRKIKSW